VLHADETPVAMLKPGNGKTHRAYLWTYCTTSASNPIKAVVFDFARPARAARARVPGPGHGGLARASAVTDDFSGYKACFEPGRDRGRCMAHARRKFHDLWANHGSQVGERAAAVLRRGLRGSSARSKS
jgi:hypothetical protein